MGEMAIEDGMARIETVLGSCIAVVLFDQRLGCGGMNHFLISEAQTNGPETLQTGYTATRSLVRAFKMRGSQPRDLKAWIAGGGDNGSELSMAIARDNAAVARRALEELGIQVVGFDTGGSVTRQLRLELPEGRVLVKRETLRPELKMSPARSRVLIVDDSKPIRQILRRLIEAEPGLEVIAEAENADQAEKILQDGRADVMTLDIQMPGRTGVDLLRDMRAARHQVPAILVTDYNKEQGGLVLEGLALGAFDYIKKPSLREHEQLAALLIPLLKQAASRSSPLNTSATPSDPVRALPRPPDLILIGSSTGGTEALKSLVPKLAANSPPVVVVQHMPKEFTKPFADRLNELSQMRVKEAESGDELVRGTALIAPGGLQLRINGNRIELRDDPPVKRFKPSVDYLFASEAQASRPERDVLALLLTGMGDDGAEGLSQLKKKGAMTVAQSEASCLVFGMPRAAIELNAADWVLSLEQMVDLINRATGVSTVGPRAKKAI